MLSNHTEGQNMEPHQYFLAPILDNRSQIIFIILINLIFVDTLFSKTHPQIDGLKNIK